MAVTAKFQADFTSFFSAVQKAEVEMRGLETGAGRVEKSLNRMVDSFSGRKIIQDAALAAEAVERIGGATQLTEAEQRRLNTQLQEGLAKYKALGLEAPKGLQDTAAETKRLVAEADKLKPTADSGALSFKSLFGAFSLANIAGQAVGFITTEVGRFVEQGAKLPAIQQSFNTLSTGIQQNSQEMLSALRTGTRGMVSELDLMQSANKAMLLGLPVTTKSMGELSAAATALGRAMGQDATKSLDDFITALGRSSPLILDNLGLSVKLGDAYEVKAQKLGKATEQLTESEQKMAFYEAAMEAARKKTAELGEQTKTLGDIAQTAWTKVGNVVTQSASDINVGIGKAVSSMRDFAQFSENVVKFGVAVAVQMSAARAEAEKLKLVAKDTNLALPTKPLDEFRKSLDDIRKSTVALTPEQRKLAREADALGVSVEKIAKGLNVSERSVQKYLDGLEGAAEKSEKAQEETKKLVTAFKEFGETLDRAITPEARQKAIAATAKRLTELKESVADVIAHIKPFLPAVEGLQKGMEGIGKQVDVVVPKIVTFGEEIGDNLKKSLGNIPQVFVDAFTGGGGLLGAMKALGTQVVDAVVTPIATGLSTKLKAAFGAGTGIAGAIGGAIGGGSGATIAGIAGSLGGATLAASGFGKAMAAAGVAGSIGLAAATAGIGLAAVGVVKLIQHMNQGRKTVKQFAESFGGFDNLRERLSILGDEGERLWQKLTQETANSDKKGAQAVINEINAALEKTPDALNKMLGAALTGGPALTASMAPYLEQLIRAGQLTEENANLLLGLPAKGIPSFDEVSAAAERLGLNTEVIGQNIKQLGFDELVNSVAGDLDTLARAGADMTAVLSGSHDKIQQLVTDAQKFGFSLPESIKPFLQQMVDAGDLTDLFGEKLEDLDDLHFTKPLEKSVDELIKAMKELVGVIKDDVGGALDDLGRRVVRPRIEIDASGTSVDLGDLNVPGFATGTRGRYVDFGRGTLAMLHGKERIVPQGEHDGGTVTVTMPVYLDGRQIYESVETVALKDVMNRQRVSR